MEESNDEMKMNEDLAVSTSEPADANIETATAATAVDSPLPIPPLAEKDLL